MSANTFAGLLALGAAVVLMGCEAAATQEQALLPSPTAAVISTVTSSAGPTPAPTVSDTRPVTSTPSGPVVKIATATFAVELAITPSQHVQGLSGRPKLPPGTGMLFIFQQEATRAFWMKDMRFPLDMVWISAQCVVVDVTRHTIPPAPGQASADLLLYTPAAPVRYVLEVNAGDVEAAGIHVGDQVAYGGSLSGLYGC